MIEAFNCDLEFRKAGISGLQKRLEMVILCHSLAGESTDASRKFRRSGESFQNRKSYMFF